MLSVEVTFQRFASDKELAGQDVSRRLESSAGSCRAMRRSDANADLVELLGKMGVEATESDIATAAKKNDAIFRFRKGR